MPISAPSPSSPPSEKRDDALTSTTAERSACTNRSAAGFLGSETSVLKWFSGLYVVLIVIQVYLAGEGIFGLNVIKHSDDCDKAGANLSAAPCIGNTKTLDAHRALGQPQRVQD